MIKRSPGRPPEHGTRAMAEPLSLRLPVAILEEIDEIVAAREDMPDRSAVIRQLVVEALQARRKGKR